MRCFGYASTIPLSVLGNTALYVCLAILQEFSLQMLLEFVRLYTLGPTVSAAHLSHLDGLKEQ